MKQYKEFQVAWWLLIVFVITLAFVMATYLGGRNDLVKGSPFLIVVVFILIGTQFYGMTTIIDTEKIAIRFGIGLIRKNIAIEKIKSVKTKKSSWLSGWGIRFIRGGMLYNISGLNCVELTFHHTDRIIKIGTKNSAHLKAEIEKYIKA